MRASLPALAQGGTQPSSSASLTSATSSPASTASLFLRRHGNHTHSWDRAPPAESSQMSSSSTGCSGPSGGVSTAALDRTRKLERASIGSGIDSFSASPEVPLWDGLSTHMERNPSRSRRQFGEERDRHVSFGETRNIEIVQFNIDEERSQPITSRGSRRVFGGELQVHMLTSATGNGNASSGSSGYSNHGPIFGPSGGPAPTGSFNNHTRSLERLPHVCSRDSEASRSVGHAKPNIRDLAQASSDTPASHS